MSSQPFSSRRASSARLFSFLHDHPIFLRTSGEVGAPASPILACWAEPPAANAEGSQSGRRPQAVERSDILSVEDQTVRPTCAPSRLTQEPKEDNPGDAL